MFLFLSQFSSRTIWSSGQDSWFSPRRPGFDSRYGNQQYFLHQVMDTFHLTQISGNSGSKSNGTEIFRKFVSKISAGSPLEVVHFSGNLEFRKFPVPFGISTRYELAPVPLVVKSYKMAASLSSQHYTGCKMICLSSSLFLIEDEFVRM